MKLGILLVRHPPERPSPIIPEMITFLREWRAEVNLLYADESSFDLGSLAPDCDLYVLKSGTETAAIRRWRPACRGRSGVEFLPSCRHMP
jgi:hypothetical protein